MGKTDIAKGIFNRTNTSYYDFVLPASGTEFRSGKLGVFPTLIREIDKLPVKSKFYLRDDFDSDHKNELTVIATGNGGELIRQVPGLYYGFISYIHVPPLRHRLNDLPDLVSHFSTFMHLFGYGDPNLSPADKEGLKKFRWTGNYNELKMFLIFIAKTYRSYESRAAVNWILKAKKVFDAQYITAGNQVGLHSLGDVG